MWMMPVVWRAVVAVIALLPLLSADHPEDVPVYQTTPDKASLPDNFLSAIAYVPEAVKICIPHLDSVVEAEANEVDRIRETGYAPGQHSFHMVQQQKGCTPHDKKLSYASILQTTCLSTIKERFSLSNDEMKELMLHLPNILQREPSTEPHSNALECPYPANVTCLPVELYRTYDGRCNNLLKPLWGSSHQPLARFLPPDYADAISKPRVSHSGQELPNARLLSASIHQNVDIPDYFHTLMLMLMGQFLDHDMSKTAGSKIAKAEGTELEDVECGKDGCQTDGPQNRECFPIHVPYNDSVYGGLKRCLKFVRSLGVTNENCDPGPREHVNQLTSYLDASQVYGSTEKEALRLRELSADRGRLKVTSHPAGGYKPLLPLNLDDKHCRGDNRTVRCFKAGDGRVNEWSGLTTQHTIWVREHNRIEEKLHELNPHWNSERLFQETRRVIIALWQFTVFKEYLPIIVGPDAMQFYGLQLVRHGYWNDYDENVKANIANDFATAAMRFGHTQVMNTVHGRDASYHVVQNITLSSQFNNPHLLYEEPWRGMDMMLRGFVGDSSQTCDQFVANQITHNLFTENPPRGLGEDLATLNIQRGRDHGIPGYNWYREWCGLKRATTFYDLVELPARVIDQFRRLYEHPDDIDLWPAGIAERPSHGALLGPTFTCILARQFHRLKFGDRFWFENNYHNPYPFTEAQLTEIRKFSYAKVLCENADHLPYIQPQVLFHPLSVMHTIVKRQNRPVNFREIEHVYGRSANERVPCSELPDFDLQPWAERQRSEPAAPV